MKTSLFALAVLCGFVVLDLCGAAAPDPLREAFALDTGLTSRSVCFENPMAELGGGGEAEMSQEDVKGWPSNRGINGRLDEWMGGRLGKEYWI